MKRATDIPTATLRGKPCCVRPTSFPGPGSPCRTAGGTQFFPLASRWCERRGSAVVLAYISVSPFSLTLTPVSLCPSSFFCLCVCLCPFVSLPLDSHHYLCLTLSLYVSLCLSLCLSVSLCFSAPMSPQLSLSVSFCLCVPLLPLFFVSVSPCIPARLFGFYLFHCVLFLSFSVSLFMSFLEFVLLHTTW